MTIYEAMKAAGVPIDNHESDLYVKVTPDSTRIVREYGKEPYTGSATVFTSQVDGEYWYDIPFAFDPWWESRSR